MMGMIAKGHVTGELWVVYGVFLSFRPVSGFRFYFYFYFRGKKKKKKKETYKRMERYIIFLWCGIRLRRKRCSLGSKVGISWLGSLGSTNGI